MAEKVAKRPIAIRRPGYITSERTPLDVLLEAMNRAYDKAEAVEKGTGAAAAFPFAKEAAGYCHARPREIGGEDAADPRLAVATNGLKILARFQERASPPALVQEVVEVEATRQ